jgi:hypothetical protein
MIYGEGHDDTQAYLYGRYVVSKDRWRRDGTCIDVDYKKVMMASR